MIGLAELQGLVEDADKAGLQVRGGDAQTSHSPPPDKSGLLVSDGPHLGGLFPSDAPISAFHHLRSPAPDQSNQPTALGML